MSGFENWFTFRSDKQIKEEAEAYSRRIFPYGDRQKEQVAFLLNSLLMPRYRDLSLFNYMVSKEAVLGLNDEEEIVAKASEILRKNLSRKERLMIPFYLSVLLCDLKIDEKLNYPEIEVLKKEAEKYTDS